jgi:translocation and assembly module TamB
MIKKILLAILLVIILLFAFIVFCISSQAGLKTTIWLAKTCLPGKLTVFEARGRLISDVTINRLVYRHNDTDVWLKHLRLRWQGYKLITGHVNVDKLAIYKLYITLPKAKATKTDKKSPIHFHLPIQFNLKDVNVYHVKLITGDSQPFELQALNLIAQSNGQVVTIKRLHAELNPYRLETEGHVDLSLTQMADLSGRFVKLEPKNKTVAMDYQLTGNDKTLLLDAHVEKPLSATINAVLKNVLESGEINVKGNFNQFNWPLNDGEIIQVDHGQLTMTGTQKHYQATLNTHIAGTNVPSTSLNLKGEGGWSAFNITQLKAGLLGGTIEGQANIQFAPALSFDASLSASHLNPQKKWHAWPADINATLKAKGDENAMQLRVPSISGHVRSYPLSGHAILSTKQSAWTIKDLHLALGKNTLQAKGILDSKSKLSWTVKADQLHEIDPRLTGLLESTGTFSGELLKPTVNATLQAKNLRFKQNHIAALNAHITGQPFSNQDSHVKIEGHTISVGGQQIKTVSLESVLNQTQQTLQLHLLSKLLNAEVVAKGQLKDKLWHGSVARLSLASPDFGTWTLNHAIAIEKSSVYDVSPFCLVSGKTELCLKGFYKDTNHWRSKINLKHLNLTRVEKLLPKALHVNSEINLNADIHRDFANYYGGAALYLDTLNAKYDLDKHPMTLNVKQSVIKVKLDKTGLSTDFKVQAPLQHILLSGQVALPHYYGRGLPDDETRVKAKLHLAIPKLSMFEAFVPALDRFAGQIKGDVSASGLLLDPKLTGDLALSQGQVALKKWGINLTNMGLAMHANNSDRVDLSGQVQSYGKQLQLKGYSTLNNRFSPSVLTLTGQDVQVVNSAEYQVSVSPNLTLKYNQPTLSLSGNVVVPEANIKPVDFSSTETLPSTVKVIRKASPDEDENPLSLQTNVTVTLGNKVHLALMGLYATLSGGVNIALAPNGATMTTGSIKVDKGEYKAYGQHLNISRGIISYTGGVIENPLLNVLATRTIKVDSLGSGFSGNNIIVGVHVTGFADNPKIGLYSQPSMNDSNALSYLVLGQPASQASGASLALLGQAASAMGLSGDSLSGNLQKSLGLDEFGVQSSQVYDQSEGDTQTNTSFVIGKKITKHLSLSYSVGIMLPINILKLRYLISQNWAAQTDTSSVGSGADIFYTIERD